MLLLHAVLSNKDVKIEVCKDGKMVVEHQEKCSQVSNKQVTHCRMGGAP